MKAKIKKTSEIVDVYYEQQNMHPDYAVYKESVLVNGRTFTENELEFYEISRHEEIERASVEYQMEKNPMAIGGDMFDDMIYMMNINPSFIAGAEWADKHQGKELWDKEKVCKYLKMVLETTDANYNETYIRSFQFNNVDELIEDLCKEMDE